jgi:hypothetical protein
MPDFAERYTAAWCSQDAARVATFYSPNGSLSVNGGAPAVGRGAITEVAQGFMTAFPDIEVLMDGLLVQGVSGFEVWQIGVDGLVAESRGYFDSAAYGRQLEHGVDAH